MNSLITELNIMTDTGNIFDTDMEYIIPLYQRGYAWGDKQIYQLIEDLEDASEDRKYYIGSLIVSKNKSKYEVIDGQQRLTTLYLLLNCLDQKVNSTLTFACRDRSNYTLKNIKKVINEDRVECDIDRIEPSIQSGIKIIKEKLEKVIDKENFINKLRNVVVYRIEVPEHTDLNRYFEIMNTRGEQLAQHDILKAQLMGYLPDDLEKEMFAVIWDACSDMSGYVQMHFVSRNNKLREGLFGNEWNQMPPDLWHEYLEVAKYVSSEQSEEENKKNILEIIDKNFKISDIDGFDENDVKTRFESVIDFPFFLLHVLKILVAQMGIVHINSKDNSQSSIVPELLDDKKLTDTFKNVIDNGQTLSQKISDNKAEFSRQYIICLLKTRYLFDKYIIKREYVGENTDGEWSLKSLHISGQKSNKKAYYKNSKFTRSGEWSSTNDLRTKTNIMIQSALRVSYTSPKVMHWITELLLCLSGCSLKDMNGDGILEFSSVAERVAAKAIKENFFDKCPDNRYAMGVNTPHIVFNYLDYLLWCSDKNKYADFSFEFRNSVEHWYPQNPSEGTFERWDDDVDRFGNLCIIQRNVNSKFSNMSPEAKKSTFKNMISKGSLKLRIMSDLTIGKDGQVASMYWKTSAYKLHEEEMINLLCESCNRILCCENEG